MNYSKLVGRPIVYVVLCIVVFSCSSSENEDDMPDVTNTAVEGRYSGTIELTLSGDMISVPITMTVNEDSATRFSGDFFETGNFRPCCSTNPQDGTFTFNYNPADRTIENFVIRVDFNINPDMPCTGVYRGSGTVDFDERSSIMAEMLLNDCNVSDIIGTFSITRIGGL